MGQKLNAQKTTLSQPPKVGWKRGAQGVCQWCGSTFISSTNKGQLYCNRSCGRKAMWAAKSPEQRKMIAQKTATKLLGRPSWNKGIPCRPETRAKLSVAHKTSGHQPKLRGGNGHVAPCEQMMREMLPKYWEFQYVILTGAKKGSGVATSYKVDFALSFKKWVLEIDGTSHTSRKHLDAKKDTLLASLGWRVFRVSNAQVREWYTTFKSTGRIPIQLPER